MDQRDFRQYTETFIQRLPWYTVKQKDKSWKTKKKPLSDRAIKAHLNGQYYVGVLGKWYPSFSILDIDERDENKVEEIREAIGLDTNNSMKLSSESPNSYHLLVRVAYNGKPPTIRLLNEVLKPFGQEKGIEIYPQPNKTIRLPFGKNQKPLDFEYANLDGWKDYLRWFNKLDDFDLREVPNHQLMLDLNIEPVNGKVSDYEEGKFLYLNGLIEKSSRNDSQFKVLYFLWRNNYALTNAIEMTWQWIKNKHNGYSKEVNSGKWRTIKNEIIRQANWIYSNYDLSGVYPDEIHNVYRGYITKADIEKILHISRAGLPMAKFLFNLIKYCYPRRYKTFINIHSNFLREWSFRNYQKYLDSLQELGVIKRYKSYRVKEFSKSISINWNFKEDTNLIILTDKRAPETFEETVRVSYKPEEFRELLEKAGAKRTSAIMAVKSVFESVKNVTTYNNSYIGCF